MTVRDDLREGLKEARLLGSDYVVLPVGTVRFFYEARDFVVRELIQVTWPEGSPEPSRDPLVRILIRMLGLTIDEAISDVERELYYERRRREAKAHRKYLDQHTAELKKLIPSEYIGEFKI